MLTIISDFSEKSRKKRNYRQFPAFLTYKAWLSKKNLRFIPKNAISVWIYGFHREIRLDRTYYASRSLTGSS